MKKIIEAAEKRCQPMFARIDEIALENTAKVLDALQRHEVAARHFAPTTGYGYDDIGRDTLEKLFADLFHADAAIVRPQIASGTHALSMCLFGLLRPGDELLYASGGPYDTLEDVIGVRGCPPGSLREMGVSYAEVPMGADGRLDLAAIRAAMKPCTRVVAVQRSRGYSSRPSLMPEDVAPLAEMLKRDFPDAVLMVDNCYGEFVCTQEPTEALELGTPERLIAFCQGIQMASPIDSMALPEPWDMPGYQHQVIMAAGTFVSGASIELSADAPMREPYTAFLQGGLTYSHGKLALTRTFEYMQKKGLL